MTIINNTHKFIYVHVPKTAGTSITTLFSPLTTLFDLEIGATDFGEKIQDAYHERFQISKHSGLTEIYKAVGDQLFKNCFKFSFVRNPFDRIFSTYNFLRSWDSPDRDFNNLMQSFKSFSQFICSNCLVDRQVPDNMFFPQSHWLCSNTDDVALDFIGKVEDLSADIASILNIIKVESLVDKSKIQILNESVDDLNKLEINSQVIEKIINIYKDDFVKYKYDLNPNFSKYLASN
jgi:hypothetical protein